jgi:peptidoglycan/LPS O-acetylase OafA/YrhL
MHREASDETVALDKRGAGMTRMHGLDGMRGAAMVCVAIMHAYGSTPATFWIWTTPDMFFALSGFLITGILLRDFSASWSSLRIFWMRRILRIWPVYYLALCSTLAIFVLVPLLLGKNTREIDYLSESFFFLQFWRDYLPSNFGAPIVGWWEDYVPWFGHAWTLAMEEQYYVLWPLLLMSLLPRPRLLLAAMVALLVAGMLLHCSTGASSSPVRRRSAACS